MWVLDASVALKWFVPAERDRERALDVLHAVRDRPRQFAVPELFFNEMLSVFCRTRGGSGEDLRGYLQDLEELGLTRVGNGHELLQEALRMALDCKLSGYDAIYAATASLLQGRWLTADVKAARRCKPAKLAVTLDRWEGLGPKTGA